jgi:hypothetical protein
MLIPSPRRALPAIAICLIISGCNIAYDANTVGLSDAGDTTTDTGDSGTADMSVLDLCIPESDTDICQRLGAECGMLNANDNCGVQRTILSCGMCDVPAAVCQINTCHEADCKNTVDDDGDGKVDCLDVDCLDKKCGAGNRKCQANGECL